MRLETRLLNGSYLRFGDNPQNPLGTRSGTEQKVSEKSDRMTDGPRSARARTAWATTRGLGRVSTDERLQNFTIAIYVCRNSDVGGHIS